MKKLFRIVEAAMGSLATNRLGFLVVCLGVLVWVFFLV